MKKLLTMLLILCSIVCWTACGTMPSDPGSGVAEVEENSTEKSMSAAENGEEESVQVEQLFFESPPKLTVAQNGQQVQALQGTYSWHYQNPDGTTTGIEADSMHPLDSRAYMPVLSAADGEATLVFETTPDAVTVRAWPVSQWGNLDAVEDAEPVPLSGDKLSLLEGGWIYEVIAEWTRYEAFGGTAHYSFWTSPLGVTLAAEDITPTGFSLICTQSGGAPTGELQTGSFFWLERLVDDQWEPVPTVVEDVAWTEEAWIIPKDQSVRWPVNWERLYSELPPGQYRMGKELTDFRGTGDYDVYSCYAAFTVE